jgi:uncharacterized RDD family membrane protein YckC
LPNERPGDENDGFGAGEFVATAEFPRWTVPWARRAAAAPSASDPAPGSACCPDGLGVGAAELYFAGFGARVGAAVLDFVIVQVVSALIESMFFGAALRNLTGATIMAATVGPLLACGAFAFFYSVWLEASVWQATPGKRIMGLKVVDLDGRRIGLGRSSCRNLAKALSVLTLGVGYLMPLWSRRNQALHDKVAGCLVVRAA